VCVRRGKKRKMGEQDFLCRRALFMLHSLGLDFRHQQRSRAKNGAKKKKYGRM
jgi:hypothetical protein